MLRLLRNDPSIYEAVRFMEERLDIGFFEFDISNETMRWSPGLFKLFNVDSADIEPSIEAIEDITGSYEFSRSEIYLRIELRLQLSKQLSICFSDGRHKIVSIDEELIVDQQNMPDKVIGYFRDITKERDLVAYADTSRCRLQALTSAGPQLICLGHPDGRVKQILGWRERTGLGPEESRDWGWLAAVHPDDRDLTLEARKAGVLIGEPYAGRLRVRRSDGSYSLMETRCVPIKNGEGRILEWIGMSSEVAPAEATPHCASVALTGAQIRGARGILNLSVRDLSEKSGVSAAAIRRLESFDGVAARGCDEIYRLGDTMTKAGVEFFTTALGKPGVRPL